MDITSISNSFEKFYALFGMYTTIGIFEKKTERLIFGGLENETFKKEIRRSIESILYLQTLIKEPIKKSIDGSVYGDFIISIKTNNGMPANKLFECMVIHDCLSPLEVLGTTTEHLTFKSMERLKIPGRDIMTTHGNNTQYVYTEENLLRRHVLRADHNARKSGIIIDVYNNDPQKVLHRVMELAPRDCRFIISPERTRKGFLVNLYIVTPDPLNYIGFHISCKEKRHERNKLRKY
jgi:hypothetical protein